MTYRAHRTMAKAIGVFMLLWLSGVLLLRPDAGDSGSLRQLWQRDLGEGYHLLTCGTRGGIYISSTLEGLTRLQRIAPDGSPAWEKPYASSVHRQDIQEFDDRLCIMGVDGRVWALDYEGTLLWEFQPDFTAVEAHMPQPDSPQAQLYCRSGVLVYGLDLQGELCWVVNTGQDKIYSFRDPGITWNGKPAYVIDDSYSVRILSPDGSMEKVDFRKVLPESGNPSLNRTRLKLAAQLGNQLLLVDDHHTVLLSDEGARELDITVDKYAAEFALSIGGAAEGRIMIPLDRTRLAEFDQAGKQLSVLDLQDAEVQRSLAIGELGYALLLSSDDEQTEQLLRLALILPWFEKILLILCGQDTKSSIKGTGMHVRLQVVCDGIPAGKRDLGTWQWQQEYPQVISDGQLLYVIFNESQLSCYEPGEEQ